MPRRTRIVATLGPATDRPGVLEQLLDAGLDVARINFSHGEPEELRARITQLRDLAKSKQRTVAIMADLPGPKLRVLLPEPIELTAGQQLTIAVRPSAASDIQITEPEALVRAKLGQRVLIDDGRLQAHITGVNQERLTITMLGHGTLQPKKGINLPDTELQIPAVTKRDRDAVATACAAGADWLALSFVRDAAACHELRGVVRGHGCELPLLAKIERPEAIRRAAEIIDAFDGIMVARGDLGVEIPLEKVPHVQKGLIAQARIAGKPVITATDMLDSMRQNPRPTRAEVSDVANAVYDGTDAVMLSGETAVGDFPVEAFVCMNKILVEAESHQADDAPRQVPIPRGELVDHVTHMTCTLAHDVGAEAIVAPTITGRTARFVARHRPRADIVAVTSETVMRQLGLVWGVHAVPALPDVHEGDDRLTAAVRAAFVGGAVRTGAMVVVLAGHPVEGGEGLPTIRLARVGPEGRTIEP